MFLYCWGVDNYKMTFTNGEHGLNNHGGYKLP